MATKTVPSFERIPLEIKEAIKKASSFRSRLRLVKIGMLEEEVENMSREQLMEAWVQQPNLEVAFHQRVLCRQNTGSVS
jgi:hypothetical protein